MKKARTDNSFFDSKVKLRIDFLPEKKEIKVLDCFAGKGLLWDAVKKITKKNIYIVSIEKEKNKNKNKNTIQGDNRKVLPGLKIEEFDIIDVDAYGVPVDQLDILSEAGYSGIVFYTSIIVGLGTIPFKVLAESGISEEMYKKCKSIYRSKFEMFFNNYLIKRFAKQDKKYYIYNGQGYKMYGVIKPV